MSSFASNSSDGKEAQEQQSQQDWCVILLAAGYGSRLVRDIESDADARQEFSGILHLPKALLPVSNVPLLDYWLSSFRDCKNCRIPRENVFIVTNDKYHHLFLKWASLRSIPQSNILNDLTTSNETRLGAAADISLCLKKFSDKIKTKDVLVIAGDTLFYDDLSLDSFLSNLPSEASGIVHYNVPDEEVNKRGIINIDPSTNFVTSLLEKPKPQDTTSRKACPAMYAYRNFVFNDIHEYVQATIHLPLEQRDAPGALLGWLLSNKSVKVASHEIGGRFDIGNLKEYRDTLSHFNGKLQERCSQLPVEVIERCQARIGLIGNPSDGFNGKTVSFLIENFFAEVKIVELEDKNQIKFIPHPVHDSNSFQSLEDLQYQCITKGYYGGLRLLMATLKSFSALCFDAGNMLHLQRGFSVSYDTNIPRMVGLSGSSAIIVATFKALLNFFGLTLKDLNLTLQTLPQFILDIEKKELSMAAGLQDRVIQSYGGLVHMDFSLTTGNQPIYTRLDPSSLPAFYLAYNTNAGEESGKVHSTVKERWAQKDPKLVAGMKALGDYADEARGCLASRNYVKLGNLMDMNFAMRRELYSDAVVGSLNISMVDLAKSLGFSAKFTGSGGAIICLREVEPRVLELAEEEKIVKQFRKHGFNFVKIEVSKTENFYG